MGVLLLLHVPALARPVSLGVLIPVIRTCAVEEAQLDLARREAKRLAPPPIELCDHAQLQPIRRART